MSSVYLYRVGRADFDTLAAIGTPFDENDERTVGSRPDRVLGARQQAGAAALAASRHGDAHGSAH